MIMEENNELSLDCISIGLIGLGYVGLPLAIEFGKKFETFGFDKNSTRKINHKTLLSFIHNTNKF